MIDVKDTREAVGDLVRELLSAANYASTPSQEDQIRDAAAMLLRLLSRAEAAEQDRDAAHASAREAHYDACRTVERCLVEAKATARADALREAAATVRGCDHDMGWDREMGPLGCGMPGGCACAGIYYAILALIPQEPRHAG